MKGKILIVEDNESIANNMIEYLSNHSEIPLEISWADNGLDGLELALDEDYDIVLLDVMLPGMNGYNVCKKVREKKDVTIIFMTAKGAEEDVLNGYAMGGDDYLVKPFSLAQLSAKIKAILKRNMASENILVKGNISINLSKASVAVAGEEVHLPLKEYEMLKYFMNNANRLVTKEMLIVNVWDYDSDITERTIDNHIKKLRKIISKGDYEVVTLRKQGYIFRSV